MKGLMNKNFDIKKWKKVYFCLAALDLIAVGLSLFVNHHLGNQYKETIQSNEFLANRLEVLENLQVLASDVNAPGNDVFDSENVSQEKTRLTLALANFYELHDKTLIDLKKHNDKYSLEKVISNYRNIQVKMNEMLGETALIFKYFDNNEKTLAGSRMATMDRRYAELRTALILCSKEIRKIQKSFLDKKKVESDNLRYFELAFSFFMILMVIGILCFGTVMSNFVTQSIQNKKSLEEQTNALHSAAIVSETDLDGRIIYANEKLLEISKYERKELIGQDHRVLNSGHHPKEFFRELWSSVKNGKGWNKEIKNKAKDGNYYWADTTIYPVKNERGELEKFITIGFNITDKVNNQISLENATTVAQKAVEAKSSFLANMSHEIRTPLNGILGFTGLLYDQKLPEEAVDYVDQIKNCSESLLMIINDILDISKIEAGKLSIEKIPLDLRKTIDSSLFVFNAIVSQKNISLNLTIDKDVPNVISGDPLRLRQILLNLIGNAVKFTDKGSIDIHVTFAKQIDDNNFDLQFMIKDSGIGISKEAIIKLFNSFEQADSSTTRKYGGTGLGLSICSSLVSSMNGKIWAESEEGKGTSFIFTIQSSVAVLIGQNTGVELLNSQDSEKVSSSKNLKILVAEDNNINRKLAKGILKKLGYEEVDFAENGKLAVEASQNKIYDLILMDVQMPEMDGLEATRIIKKNVNQETLIVGLSANVFDEDKKKAKEAGMDDYLEKLIRTRVLSQLLQTIEKSKRKVA